jgi:hypothetical protein
MRRLLASCLVVVVALGGGPALAQNKAKAQNVPEIPADIRPFLKMPPGMYMGEAIGVATNSKGHVFVYTRSANTRLFEFDQNGAYVREIGEGSYGFEFAHAVRVDPQENIRVVERATWYQVQSGRTGRDGDRPSAGCGRRRRRALPDRRRAKYPDDRRCRGSAGSIFVSDGTSTTASNTTRTAGSRAGGQVKAGRFAGFVRRMESRPGPAGQRLRVGPRQHTDSSVRQQPGAESHLRQHRRFVDVCVSPGAPVSVLSTQSHARARVVDITGEIYRVELTARSSGVRPRRHRRERFRWSTMIAGIRTDHRRSSRGVKDHAEAAGRRQNWPRDRANMKRLLQLALIATLASESR